MSREIPGGTVAGAIGPTASFVPSLSVYQYPCMHVVTPDTDPRLLVLEPVCRLTSGMRMHRKTPHTWVPKPRT